MLQDLTPASLRPHIGEPFRVVLPAGGSPTIELVEVNAFEAAQGAPRREPFSLLFSGPTVPTLPQQIYRLEHDALGVLEIFLVPIAPGRYEAVFN